MNSEDKPISDDEPEERINARKLEQFCADITFCD